MLGEVEGGRQGAPPHGGGAGGVVAVERPAGVVEVCAEACLGGADGQRLGADDGWRV